jgi:hypothetical protein
LYSESSPDLNPWQFDDQAISPILVIFGEFSDEVIGEAIMAMVTVSGPATLSDTRNAAGYRGVLST